MSNKLQNCQRKELSSNPQTADDMEKGPRCDSHALQHIQQTPTLNISMIKKIRRREIINAVTVE